MTNTIIVKARNNADARRMGSGEIRIPAATATHIGRKDVRLVSSDSASTIRWLDACVAVVSYSVE